MGKRGGGMQSGDGETMKEVKEERGLQEEVSYSTYGRDNTKPVSQNS